MGNIKYIKLICFVLILVIGLGALIGCSSGPADTESQSTSNANTGSIETEKSEKITAEKVSSQGGTITISDSDTTLDGMEITVSPGAYTNEVEFSVSCATISEHSFGDAFNPISPLIMVDNGEVLADLPVEVTIPVTVPEGQFAMGFLYDASSGQLEGLPLADSDGDSITVVTRHFSDIVVSAINPADLIGDIDSGFRPGVDDWQFTNRGSYIAPKGHCSGQSMTAMFYYISKPDGPNATLYGRYDNNGNEPATPDFWYDDSLGYRFASVIQQEENFSSERRYETYALHKDPVKTLYLFAYSIKLTGQPQMVGIASSAAGGAHAMIAYRYIDNKLYVADPNYPGNTNRFIAFENNQFSPYNSGANADEIAAGHGKEYDIVYYSGKTALIDWQTLHKRWAQVKDGTSGNDHFPSYEINWYDKDKNKHKLEDGLETSEKFLKVYYSCPALGSQAGAYVFRNQQRLANQPEGIELIPGENKLGFLIAGLNTESRYEYIDFKYYTVVYKEPPAAEAPHFVLAETKLSPLPEQPYTWSDEFGKHSATFTLTDKEIGWDIRTAGPGGTEAGASTLSMVFDVPSVVPVGEEVKTVANCNLTVSGEKPRYTMAYIELYGGQDRYRELKRFSVDQEPTGTSVMEWKIQQNAGEFEVKAKVPFQGGDITIQWIYRPGG